MEWWWWDGVDSGEWFDGGGPQKRNAKRTQNPDSNVEDGDVNDVVHWLMMTLKLKLTWSYELEATQTALDGDKIAIDAFKYWLHTAEYSKTGLKSALEINSNFVIFALQL